MFGRRLTCIHDGVSNIPTDSVRLHQEICVKSILPRASYFKDLSSPQPQDETAATPWTAYFSHSSSSPRDCSLLY